MKVSILLSNRLHHNLIPIRIIKRLTMYYCHLQLNMLLLKQLIPINILDRILGNITKRLLKLMRLLGTIRKQVLAHQLLRRLTEPLEQREVLELVGAEDLEDFDVFVVAEVLDEVAHVAGHDANVAGLVVEGAGGALGGEDGDARAAFDEVRPFVGVG